MLPASRGARLLSPGMSEKSFSAGDRVAWSSHGGEAFHRPEALRRTLIAAGRAVKAWGRNPAPSYDLEDQLRLGVPHARMHLQVLEHEVAQSGGRLDGDVQQVVVGSGDVEDAHDVRDVAQARLERLHLVARVAREADGDDGLEPQAQGGWIDLGAKAADDARLAEGAQALAAGRLGDPDALGERGVRESPVRVELGEHREITDCP